MKHLYFIGNGFDIHHNLPTRYTDFREWLREKDFEAYEWMITLYDVDDEDENGDISDETWTWWSYFESHLVDFEVYDEIVAIANDNQINYGADDFSDGDRYRGAIEAEAEFEKLMSRVLGYFDEWVDSIDIEQSCNKIKLDRDADFLTFNYTRTMELVYNIPAERVHHIHGEAGKGNYILGHGKSYQDIEDEIRSNEPIPDAGTPEEMEEWYSSNYDEVYENTVGSTASTLRNYKKDVKKIIEDNFGIFYEMRDVEVITIMGYSFSPIDNPYLSYIIDHASNKEGLKFEVFCYSETDKKNAKDFFQNKAIAKEQYLPYLSFFDILEARQLTLDLL